MHELTVAQSILDVVLKEAGQRKITEISLVLGELACVAEESVKFCFEAISQGTRAEGALISLTKVQASFQCRHCLFEFGLDQEGLCPSCGQRKSDLIRGKEFYIESVEVEDMVDEDRGSEAHPGRK
jgi:hydrogenase nickel incorporation protein HypA/HybF